MLQEVAPETALLLWPARAEPVENPDSPQQAGAYQQEAQAALDQLEAGRWRISPGAVLSYQAAVPSLTVSQESVLRLAYDAGGLAVKQRDATQQATMAELLDAFARLSESIAREG